MINNSGLLFGPPCMIYVHV